MRLRVLYVKGMPRPMVIIDGISADTDMEVAGVIKARVRDALPEYDVLLISDVDLPQVRE